MKMIIVVALAFVALAAGAAVPVSEPILIVRSNSDQNPDGSYNFGFETENGISRQETGVVKELLDEEKKPHVVVVVRGSYTYPNEVGQPETVNYYADENGFHAEGDSIPKPVSRR